MTTPSRVISQRNPAGSRAPWPTVHGVKSAWSEGDRGEAEVDRSCAGLLHRAGGGVPGPLAVHMTVRWQHLVDARMRSVLRGVPGVQASTQEEGSRPRCLPSLPATTAAVQPPRMAFSYTVRRMFVSQTASQTIFRANSGRCSCNGVPPEGGSARRDEERLAVGDEDRRTVLDVIG